MKTKACSIAAAVLALLIGSASSRAQNQYQPAPYPWAANYPSSRYYFNADVGGVLMQSVSIENLQARVGFNPGMRTDFLLGYNLTSQAAIEFETGLIWSSLNGSGPQIISPVADNADLYQIPLLANFVFKVPLKGGFTPYIGGGAGGIVSTLRLSQGNWFDNSISDSDFTFAYQGMAGLKYALGENMEVGVGYKFLGTLDHRWFGDDPNLYVHTSPTYSHSILATFTWRF